MLTVANALQQNSIAGSATDGNSEWWPFNVFGGGGSTKGTFKQKLENKGDAEYFGVLDQVNFYEESDGSVAKNAELTNFRFDRNYHVDQLLFREARVGVRREAYRGRKNDLKNQSSRTPFCIKLVCRHSMSASEYHNDSS